MLFYRLDGKTPQPCDLDEWARLPFDESRRVALDRVSQVEISTVFLGLDHQLGRGKPLLFETMVFGGKHDGRCRRYPTWDEALRGHAITVAEIREGEEP